MLKNIYSACSVHYMRYEILYNVPVYLTSTSHFYHFTLPNFTPSVIPHSSLPFLPRIPYILSKPLSEALSSAPGSSPLMILGKEKMDFYKRNRICF